MLILYYFYLNIIQFCQQPTPIYSFNNMPQTKIDMNQALSIIAQYVSLQVPYTQKLLIEQPMLLDEAIKSIKCDWVQIGSQLNLTRQQIYRWYYDTHQRNLYGQISPEDKLIIKESIRAALLQGIDLDSKFQDQLKSKLLKSYQRNAFTVVFNNQKRLLLKSLNKQQQLQPSLLYIFE
ncbi:Conserved_hypothetical protein [Hexamita inflata]|uniref:Homeodomain protein n=1 Tax=Hexamita inflata TaxID=28002 RepID=A0ABP1GT85_9EUKA